MHYKTNYGTCLWVLFMVYIYSPYQQKTLYWKKPFSLSHTCVTLVYCVNQSGINKFRRSVLKVYILSE